MRGYSLSVDREYIGGEYIAGETRHNSPSAVDYIRCKNKTTTSYASVICLLFRVCFDPERKAFNFLTLIHTSIGSSAVPPSEHFQSESTEPFTRVRANSSLFSAFVDLDGLQVSLSVYTSYEQV